jgi:hypothetical protein
MASVHINDAVFRQLSQPKMERHHRIRQIVLQTLRRFHQDILHDIAGIDATSHGLIESHLDHAPNSLPMPIHQAIDGLRITIGDPFEKFLSLFTFRPHKFLRRAAGKKFSAARCCMTFLSTISLLLMLTLFTSC